MPFKMKGYQYPGKSPIKAKEELSNFEKFQSMGNAMGTAGTASVGGGLAQGLADAGKAFSKANIKAQTAKGNADVKDAERALSDAKENIVDDNVKPKNKYEGFKLDASTNKLTRKIKK